MSAINDKYIGSLDLANPDGIRGWVFSVDDPDTPVQVDILINDNFYKRVTANLERPDLYHKNMHPTGRCGFIAYLSNMELARQQPKVSVTITGKNKPISPSLEFRDDPARRQLNDRIHFIHIPKTAGTTFRLMLNTIVYNHQVMPNELEFINQAHSYLSIEELMNIDARVFQNRKIFLGHYPYITNTILPSDFEPVVFLREPVQRAISNLRHLMRHAPEHKGRSVDDLLQDEIVQRHQLANLQVKYFADHKFSNPFRYFMQPSGGYDALKAAQENLQRCSFVGLTEYFHSSVSLFEQKFHVSCQQIDKQNTSDITQTPLTDAQVETIREMNTLDSELYQFASKVFFDDLRTHQIPVID